MKINKPLIVFGRDTAETYPLLVAIARRRLREETRAKRRLRIKRLVFGYLAKLGLRGGSNHQPICKICEFEEGWGKPFCGVCGKFFQQDQIADVKGESQ